MVTYTDKYPLNARVDINYKDRTVKFSYPVKPTFARFFDSVFFPMRVLSGQISLIMTLIIGVALINKYLPEHSIVRVNLTLVLILYYLSVIAIIPGILTCIVILGYKLFNTAFPKLNTYLSGTSRKIIRVTKLKSKKFELPFFKNILLNYEAYDDFDDYLERIISSLIIGKSQMSLFGEQYFISRVFQRKEY